MKYKSQSGFTIVELLIVVVVIAILAAITIVSYNGITTQANESASKSVASTVQKKAELYYADEGVYPTQAQLTAAGSSSEVWYLASSSFGTPSATTGKSVVNYVPCPASGTPTGARIHRWLYEASTPAVSTPATGSITIGSCS